MKKYYGFELNVSKNKTDKNVINLSLSKLNNSIPGAYNMNVADDKIYIEGNDEEGVFYGIQTLIQLLPAEKSNSLAIQQCRLLIHHVLLTAVCILIVAAIFFLLIL